MLERRAMELFRFKKLHPGMRSASCGDDLDACLEDSAVTSPEVADHNFRRTVLLKRGEEETWGFTLQSYVMKQDRSLSSITYVDYIASPSPAHLSGLRKGDVILSVNGVSMETLSHQEIVEHVRSANRTLRMVVIFDNVCRKVELNERQLKLNSVLRDKLTELKALEALERKIMRGEGVSSLPSTSGHASETSSLDSLSVGGSLKAPSVDSLLGESFSLRSSQRSLRSVAAVRAMCRSTEAMPQIVDPLKKDFSDPWVQPRHPLQRSKIRESARSTTSLTSLNRSALKRNSVVNPGHGLYDPWGLTAVAKSVSSTDLPGRGVKRRGKVERASINNLTFSGFKSPHRSVGSRTAVQGVAFRKLETDVGGRQSAWENRQSMCSDAFDRASRFSKTMPSRWSIAVDSFAAPVFPSSDNSIAVQTDESSFEWLDQDLLAKVRGGERLDSNSNRLGAKFSTSSPDMVRIKRVPDTTPECSPILEEDELPVNEKLSPRHLESSETSGISSDSGKASEPLSITTTPVRGSDKSHDSENWVTGSENVTSVSPRARPRRKLSDVNERVQDKYNDIPIPPVRHKRRRKSSVKPQDSENSSDAGLAETLEKCSLTCQDSEVSSVLSPTVTKTLIIGDISSRSSATYVPKTEVNEGESIVISCVPKTVKDKSSSQLVSVKVPRSMSNFDTSNQYVLAGTSVKKSLPYYRGFPSRSLSAHLDGPHKRKEALSVFAFNDRETYL